MVLKIGYAKINKSPGTLPENFGQKNPAYSRPYYGKKPSCPSVYPVVKRNMSQVL